MNLDYSLFSPYVLCSLFFLYFYPLHMTLSSHQVSSHCMQILSLSSLPLIHVLFFPLPSNLSQFICFTCFPIHPKQNHKSQYHFSRVLYAIKFVIFGAVLHIYNYRHYLPSSMLLFLYPLHQYLSQYVLLTLLNVVVTVVTFGCKLEPLFNEPYLATSLQDFWSRRWNLTVSYILRWIVYDPVRWLCKHSKWSVLFGVLETFFVSGLSHEVLFFHGNREKPTGQVTLFFVFHGVCLVAEGAMKRMARARGWVVKPVVSRLLTVGFLVVTSGWLFFPLFKQSGMMDSFANESLLLLDFTKRQLFM